MKLVGKVPVEPLEEERLTNIERSLVVRVSEMSQRPLRAPGRMLAFAGVALAVVAAGVVGYKLRTPAAAPPAIHETLALSHQALDLGDAQIASSANAVATIERGGGRVVVTMKIGKLDLHVDHKPGRLFVVRAGDVEIEDVGTRFSVAYDGHDVDVRVTEGAVKVRSKGKEEQIRASEAWTLELGKTTIVALDQHAGRAIVAAATEPQAGSAVVTPSTPTPALPVPAAPTDSEHPRGGSAESHPRGGKADTPKALEKRPIREIEIPEVTDKTVGGYVAYASRQTDEMQKAAALYDAAVLQYRAKNDDGALDLLRGLLRADRSEKTIGEAYPLALWLQVRIRCKTFDDKCSQAAELYLHKFPSGPEAGIAQDVLKQLIH